MAPKKLWLLLSEDSAEVYLSRSDARNVKAKHEMIVPVALSARQAQTLEEWLNRR